MEGKTYFIQSRKISQLRHGGVKDVKEFELFYEFCVGSDVHLASFAKTKNNIVSETLDIIDHLSPAGLVFGGYFLKGSTSEVEEICKNLLHKCIKDTEDSDQVKVLNIGTGEAALYSYDLSSYHLTQLELNVIDYNVLDACITLRLQGSLNIYQDCTSKHPDQFRENLSMEIELLQEHITDTTAVYHAVDSKLLFHHPDRDLSKNMTYKEILNHIVREGEDDFDRKKKQKNIDVSKVVIHFELLSQDTGECAVDKTLACSPIIHHTHGSFEQLHLQLPIDVVAYAHPDSSTELLHDLLTGAIHKQLDAMYSCLVSQKKGSVHTPVPYHFKPPNLDHIITIVYPKGIEESSLELQRNELHGLLLLPDNIPQVRRLNHFIFPEERSPGGYLVNPHIGLTPSTAKPSVSTVRGQYTYHHYMQDRMDDNGWGCAYRSLQTLVSWFRFQAYTDTEIPTHRQIQQALVDVRDKDHKFVGSKKWIGSTEVSYVLDHIFGIVSKIMFVNTGAELESKGRELAMHFNTQGTPIMIGGGVLAHTILGVDFDEVTGNIKFLILDPHYTGGEDLRIIQDKGWCGWKGPDFWDKNAHYNLCMPQAPNMI